MADFCRQCTIVVFGEEYADKNDMQGLCEPDEMAAVLCEHCGHTWVDNEGVCLGNCLEPEHINL